VPARPARFYRRRCCRRDHGQELHQGLQVPSGDRQEEVRGLLPGQTRVSRALPPEGPRSGGAAARLRRGVSRQFFLQRIRCCVERLLQQYCVVAQIDRKGREDLHLVFGRSGSGRAGRRSYLKGLLDDL
jgi:hypothetical protein